MSLAFIGAFPGSPNKLIWVNIVRISLKAAIAFPTLRTLFFYLIRGDDIDIIGVPHNAMDISDYFDSE